MTSNVTSDVANTAATAPEAVKRWTTRELLKWMTDRFRDGALDAPRVCAEMLLSHVLNCERMRLYMEVDRPATPEELAALRELVRRAVKHEPVQYLVGHAWFFSRRFEVGSATLIPRPSTETLVELGVRHLRSLAPVASTDGSDDQLHSETAFDSEATVDPDATVDLETVVAPAPATPTRVLDLCTGTGCVAISIAASVPSATLVATDLVREAIDLARRNVATHRVDDRVDLRSGSLWDPINADDAPFDLICANPPYISDAEWAEVPPNVRNHEPSVALRAGADGLDVIRPIIDGAAKHLAPGGALMIEISFSQGEAAKKLAIDSGFTDVRVERDHEGHDRVLVARR